MAGRISRFFKPIWYRLATRELDAESVQKGKTDTLAAIGKREKHLHNLLRRLHATLSKGKGGV